MSDLVLNPHLRIRRIVVDGRVTAYSLSAPVKGRGRLVHTVEIAGADPEVLHVLRGLMDADADVEVSESIFPSLSNFGVLVSEGEVSNLVRFSCHLDGDEEQAVPPSLAVNLAFTCNPLPNFVEQESTLARILAPGTHIALVTDPVTGARHPYWIDDREHELLQRLALGASSPMELARADVRRFARAGILVDEAVVAARRQHLAAAAAQFARHGYAELSQLLPSLQMAALRRYYEDLLREGHTFHQDSQVQSRYALHNEVLMQYYHRQLRGVFSQVVGRSIKPSYGYFASYRRGATLKKHCDREQCTFTASLLLDYVAVPTDDSTWPLYLELQASGEQVAIEQVPGDCVLFTGRALPHYRRELRAERSTSLFFHYVDEVFSGSLL